MKKTFNISYRSLNKVTIIVTTILVALVLLFQMETFDFRVLIVTSALLIILQLPYLKINKVIIDFESKDVEIVSNRFFLFKKHKVYNASKIEYKYQKQFEGFFYKQLIFSIFDKEGFPLHKMSASIVGESCLIELVGEFDKIGVVNISDKTLG